MSLPTGIARRRAGRPVPRRGGFRWAEGAFLAAFLLRAALSPSHAETGAGISNPFSLETRFSDQSASAASGEFALNTVNGAPTELEVVGPHVVEAGSWTPYRVRWHVGALALDVTRGARWRFLARGPSGTGMVMNRFYAGRTATGGVATIVASYVGPGGEGLDSAPFTITIVPGMQVAVEAEPAEGRPGMITFRAHVEGALGEARVCWDLDGDGEFDEAEGPTATWDYGGWTGTIVVRARVTDEDGNRRIALRPVVVNRARGANEPFVEEPALDPPAPVFSLPDEFRSPFVFDAPPADGSSTNAVDRRDGGLVVIAGDLSSDGSTGWMGEMGRAIEKRCGHLGIDPPNIALLDWVGPAAGPAECPPWANGMFGTIIESGLRTWDPDRSDPGEIAPEERLGYDPWSARGFGWAAGQQVADWIYRNSAGGASAPIDAGRPIHLIGHGAGGFLVAEAARILKNLEDGSEPVLVDLVTMLDTPFVGRRHIAEGDGGFPDPGTIERYVSSLWGRLESPNFPEVPAGPHYRSVDIWTASAPVPDGYAHEYAHDWYTRRTTWDAADPWARLERDGFYRSPIVNPSARIDKSTSLFVRGTPEGTEPEPPDLVLEEWETFGDALATNGTWTLTEAADAGIWTDFSLPAAATALAFEFRFDGAGDGDFLAVHFADLPALYRGLDLELSRDSWVPVEVPIEWIPVMDGRLVFTLVSRGAAGARVRLRNIRILQSEDPDADGLTVFEETEIGTDPRNRDTDGDGLSDGDEVNETLTDPMRADSDGDGRSDWMELRAGTDPLSKGSLFRVWAITREPGGPLTLRWSAAAGRSYTVYRSRLLGTGNLRVLATGVPTGEFTDEAPPPERVFYWVEAE